MKILNTNKNNKIKFKMYLCAIPLFEMGNSEGDLLKIKLEFHPLDPEHLLYKHVDEFEDIL